MKKKTIALSLTISALFLLGIFIGDSGTARKIYRKLKPSTVSRSTLPIIAHLDKQGLKDRIRIKNEQDIEISRNKLIKIVWGDEGIPYNKFPEKVISNFQDTLFRNFTNLKSVECIIDSLEYGFESVMFHLIPQNKDKGELMIFHHGHEGNEYTMGLATYQALLNAGYHVLSVQMPLKGRNNSPVINSPTVGKVKSINHDILVYLDKGYTLFFEPIRVAINHLQKENQFRRINMMGLSGGGWTTQLYSAMDTTIKNSYSIAGSMPICVRVYNPTDLGDMEQYDPQIYGKVSYSEIYCLGASGLNRRQIQYLNTYDPCCFRYESSEYYRDAVSSVVREISPGYFEVVADSTHREHKISEFILDHIFKDLSNTQQ